MSVLIRGMEMPKSCPCELLGIGYDLYCSFAGGIPDCVKEYYECCQNGTRPSWCPLFPVQPHGRLIDASAIWNLLYDYADSIGMPDMMRFDKIMEAAFSNAPTIIEAEEGE